jgi:hypothetical protein
MSIRDKMKNIGGQQLGGKRNEDLRVGKCYVLVDNFRERTSERPPNNDYISLRGTVVKGMSPEANQSGEKISYFYSEWNGQLEEIKLTLMSCLGLDSSQEAEVVESMLPAEDNEGVSYEERLEQAFTSLTVDAMALNEEDEAGCFDGQAVILLDTFERRYFPMDKATKKRKIIELDDGTYGPAPEKSAINTRAVGGISLGELRDICDDNELIAGFGTLARFEELLAAEVAADEA